MPLAQLLVPDRPAGAAATDWRSRKTVVRVRSDMVHQAARRRKKMNETVHSTNWRRMCEEKSEKTCFVKRFTILGQEGW
jgi:hypothetical protein